MKLWAELINIEYRRWRWLLVLNKGSDERVGAYKNAPMAGD